MNSLSPAYRWSLPARAVLDAPLLDAAAARGLSRRLLAILAARGVTTPAELGDFFDDPAAGLHDPALLPDAPLAEQRVRLAASRGEGVMVFGDFDADGLTGLAILVTALGRFGIRATPYVPSRLDEGHGLSAAAVAHAVATGTTLIITVDCGTSSVAEIQLAAAAGIDVIVTDHHHVGHGLPPAFAVVNPRRADSRYPDARLAGSGVAFKLAQLLLADEPGGAAAALEMVDLATIGTVADLAPLVGENRCICRLGLARMSASLRPGLAALIRAAGLREDQPVDLETIGFVLAPRLNAAGRVGDAAVAARLLLADDPAEVEALAAELQSANATRRDLTGTALAEARLAVAERPADPVIVVAGDWPVGVIGLVAGRLAEESGRSAVVFSRLTEPWRGSARSAGELDLATAFERGAHLFERHGGHAGAAGCTMPEEHLDALREHLAAISAEHGPAAVQPTLQLDLVVTAAELGYPLQRELQSLAPTGIGNPRPCVAISGLVAGRVRAVAGGNTQITLRKGVEVLDGIAFGRADLATNVREGDAIDVCAHLASRTFGGYESLQLELRDVAPAGTLAALVAGRDALATAAAGTATLTNVTTPEPILTGAA